MTILAVYVLFIIPSFCSGEFLNLWEILSRFIFTSKREKEETKTKCLSAPWMLQSPESKQATKNKGGNYKALSYLAPGSLRMAEVSQSSLSSSLNLEGSFNL